MKKLLLVLILFSFVTNVKAYTFYTDYQTIESDTLKEESDLIKFDKEINQYYHEDIELGPYGTNNEYKYIDKSDYIIYKSDLLKDKPKEKENRTIYKVTDNFSNKKVMYLVIKDINVHEEYLVLENLKVYIKGQEFNYGKSCNACKVENNTFYVSNSTMLAINLKDYYDIDDINVTFTINKTYNKSATFYMYFENGNDGLRKYYKEFEHVFDNEQEYNFNLQEVGMKYVLGDYPLRTRYYYIDKCYKTYNKYLISSNEYLEKPTDYFNIKGKSKYIYKVRDKLVLEDKLLIDNSNYYLNDFIKYSTKDVSIIDNIDISKDGLYEVIYKMNNTEFKVYVTVDINKDDYNKMIDIVNDYSNISKNKSNIITSLNQENNLLNQKMDLLTKDYENRILNLNTQLNSKKVNKVDNSNVLQIKQSKTNLIILITFGIVIIIYIFFKYKKYNYFCRKQIKKLKSVLNYIR